jgi:hypothetical protein
VGHLRWAEAPLSFFSPFLADYTVIRVFKKCEAVSRDKLIHERLSELWYDAKPLIILLPWWEGVRGRGKFTLILPHPNLLHRVERELPSRERIFVFIRDCGANYG